ncbi:hypothetical protein HDU76_009796, partial [Blyttiomyces sp. JEL0837]
MAFFLSIKVALLALFAIEALMAIPKLQSVIIEGRYKGEWDAMPLLEAIWERQKTLTYLDIFPNFGDLGHGRLGLEDSKGLYTIGARAMLGIGPSHNVRIINMDLRMYTMRLFDLSLLKNLINAEVMSITMIKTESISNTDTRAYTIINLQLKLAKDFVPVDLINNSQTNIIIATGTIFAWFMPNLDKVIIDTSEGLMMGFKQNKPQGFFDSVSTAYSRSLAYVFIVGIDGSGAFPMNFVDEFEAHLDQLTVMCPF